MLVQLQTRKYVTVCLLYLFISVLFGLPVRSQPLRGDSAPVPAVGSGASSQEQITIRFVNTAEELEESLRDGVTHVELTSHILLPADLTVTSATKTIRGKCNKNTKAIDEFISSIPATPLLKMLDGHCIIVARDSSLVAEGRVLLEGLYLQKLQGGIKAVPAVRVLAEAEVVMMNTVVQGSGSGFTDCSTCGAETSQGHLHMEGCVFADMAANNVILAEGQSEVFIRECAFVNITPAASRDVRSSVIQSSSTNFEAPKVALQNIMFMGTPEGSLLLHQVITSTNATIKHPVPTFFSDLNTTVALSHVHVPGPKIDELGFVSTVALKEAGVPDEGPLSVWMLAVQRDAEALGGKAVSHPIRPAHFLDSSTVASPHDSDSIAEDPASDASSQSGTSQSSPSKVSSTVVWTLSAAGAVILLALLATAFICWCRCTNRENKRARLTPLEAPDPQDLIDPAVYSSLSGPDTFDFSSVGAPSAVWVPRSQAPTLPHPDDRSTDSKLRFIRKQLESYGPDDLFNRRLTLRGPEEVVVGGQAVVQFGDGIDSNGNHVSLAIKFYANRKEFDDEVSLYVDKDRPLRGCRPAVLDIFTNDKGGIRDPFGHKLPPHIVMEKGVCLLTAMRSWGSVSITFIMKVLYDVAVRLEAFHSAGRTHRDLKPGNIMFMRRRMRWVLIDFGVCAWTGDRVSVRGTINYSPPETAAALKAPQRTMIVTNALDSWSLGIIALELMLGYHPLGPLTTCVEITDLLADPTSSLPWEDEHISDEKRERVGGFLGPIQRLLLRDPEARSSVADFREELEGRLGL